MNDARKLQLERDFDGALDAADREALDRALAADPEASRYLERLALLRRLARLHDPSVRPAVVRPRAVRGRWKRPAALAASAVAACVALLVAVPPRRPPVPAAVPRPASTASVPALSVPPAIPLEVALVRLANSPGRGPEGAARAVLSRRNAPRHRASAREILVLELANGSPRSAVTLPRAAVAPGAAASGAIRRHALPHRPHHSTHPRA